MGVEIDFEVDCSNEESWKKDIGGLDRDYYVAKNKNDVCIGYTKEKYIWAGRNPTDAKLLTKSADSPRALRAKIERFMTAYPDARYESKVGTGKLKDGDENLILGIPRDSPA